MKHPIKSANSLFILSLLTPFGPLFAQEKTTVDPVVRAVVDTLNFTEGPVWDPTTNGLIFSDIQQEKQYRWSEKDGLTVYRENTNKANGNAFDPNGRLITCEGGAHRVTRREADGNITVLAENFQGTRLNCPNDVVVRSDGTIYFTDPNYDHKEGIDRQFVYRIDPSGVLSKALPESYNKPNGIALSLDEKTLYVNIGSDHICLAFQVKEDGTVDPQSRRVADGIDRGLDGMAIHPKTGDLFLAVYWNNRRKPDEQGINVFSDKGKYKGVIPIPGNTTNICFEPSGEVFYSTSGGKVFRVKLGAGYNGQTIGNTILEK